MMADPPLPTEIDQTVALHWLRYSLDLGWTRVVSPAVLKVIERHTGHSYALVPPDTDPERLLRPKEGGVTRTVLARQALAAVLAGLADRGATCVVVEDEVKRRHDPRPSLDGLLRTAFVGDRVIHWAGLGDGPDDAVVAIDRGSLGYPTNAVVTSASPAELGLVDDADLGPAIAAAIVESLMAVIVAAYDDETYIIWEPD